MGYFQVTFSGPGDNIERLRVPEKRLLVTPVVEAQLNERQKDMVNRLVAGEELTSRFNHFLAENYEIIPAACKALARGDMTGFGAQVDRSQELADTLLGSQVPQTVFLARTARELGAEAASSFGATRR